MNTKPSIGNRANTRFQVLDCRVQLKSKGVMGLFGNEIHQLSLINISTTGIQAITTKALKNKKAYDVAILAPAYPKPILAKGRVIWQKPYTADNKLQYYRIGLEFTYFKDQTMKKIKHLERNPQLRKNFRD